ncbi:MAG TPA: hypothetical protein VF720_14175, partial [Candidatus Eisenbacteria bacterium]
MLEQADEARDGGLISRHHARHFGGGGTGALHATLQQNDQGIFHGRIVCHNTRAAYNAAIMRMRNALAGVVWLVVSAGAVGPISPALADPPSGDRARPAGPPSASHLVNLAGATLPRLSPDGSRVAFVLADSLDPTLRQIALAVTEEGIRPRPLTAGGRSADNPRWTPDGKHLLFLTSASDTSLPQIRIIDPTGGESRTLTGEPRGVADMHVSPDGRLLAWLVPGPLNPGGDPVDPMMRPPGTKLRWRELDGTKTTTLSPDSANVWRFAWAPDNRRVAALYTRPGKFGEWRRGMLAIADIESGEWRRVPGLWDPNNDVAWSAGGDSLAAYRLPALDRAYPVLHVMSVDDLDASPANRITPPDARYTEHGVIWTSGGGLVVASWEGVRTFLTRIDPASGRRTRLAECWNELSTDFSMNDAGVLAWISGGLDGPADIYARLPGDAASRRLSILNPQLAEREWPAPEVVTWRSRDDLTIEGIL